MKIFKKMKDGGPSSPVDGYFLIEAKGLFSIVLLKFNKGCRETYHNHAFNALTWFLSGEMVEERKGVGTTVYQRSLIPKVTKRDNLHRVRAEATSWCFSVRGPWNTFWKEYCEETGEYTVLTQGRKVVK